MIRPASFCGVVGYKPSVRRVPRAGVKLISDTLDEVGLFATSVDDIALLVSVVAQQPAWAMRPAQGRAGPAPTLGWTLTSRGDEAEPAMRQAVERAAQRAYDAGARADAVDWPSSFDPLFDAQRTVQLQVCPLADDIEDIVEQVGPMVGVVGVGNLSKYITESCQ